MTTFASPTERRQALEQALPGGNAQVLVRAPGRVNLIGEHTDYNGGYVLPMALDLDLWLAASPRSDGRLSALSLDNGQRVELSLDGLSMDPAHGWANYVKAVLWCFEQDGRALKGLDLVIQSRIPQGSGLSSSAALELAVARAVCALNGWDWNAPAMALLAQRAENRFIGVNCGIMDQMAVAVGEPGSALFLDCRSLESRAVPVRFKEHRLVVVHSGVTRGLKGSEYNERRSACERAVAALKIIMPTIQELRDLSSSELKRHSDGLDAIALKRARHVVGEDERVLEAVDALQAGDAPAFGALMSASHESLRQDYEVSSPELDALVELGLGLGSVGSRLTGAGFGGCTVHLVPSVFLQRFQSELPPLYRERTGLEAKIWPCLPSAPCGLLP